MDFNRFQEQFRRISFFEGILKYSEGFEGRCNF